MAEAPSVAEAPVTNEPESDETSLTELPLSIDETLAEMIELVTETSALTDVETVVDMPSVVKAPSVEEEVPVEIVS